MNKEIIIGQKSDVPFMYNDKGLAERGYTKIILVNYKGLKKVKRDENQRMEGCMRGDFRAHDVYPVYDRLELA